MDHVAIIPDFGQSPAPGLPPVPALFIDAGEQAWRRFIEFFTANIRNRNTREAYARAVGQFAGWCARRKLGLHQLTPFLIAAYIEEVGQSLARPTVKQHLAALRSLFDFLVVGQAMPTNPASSVRGPRYSTSRGKTPVLSAEEVRSLLDSIDAATLIGLRDRALIAIMVYSFARVGAVVSMNVEDYFAEGKRWWFRLHEKNGKENDVPASHRAEEHVDAYLHNSGISLQKGSPLFRSFDRKGQLTDRRLHRREVLAMLKRRCRHAGLPSSTCCHSFRASGITVYLLNGGTLEKAQRIAAHSSPTTTKLYDRTSDVISLDEVEKIVI